MVFLIMRPMRMPALAIGRRFPLWRRPAVIASYRVPCGAETPFNSRNRAHRLWCNSLIVIGLARGGRFYSH